MLCFRFYIISYFVFCFHILMRNLFFKYKKGINSLIFVTGDKHGQIEYFFENSIIRKIKKKDILIVCGDFGFLWNRSKQEYKNLQWLSKRRYTIAFVEGCNDNISMINEYPVSFWNGGKVHFISKNIVHLMQGELYEIEGKKVLAFGGGFDSNLSDDFENNNWWPESFTSKQCIDDLIKNIEKANAQIDFIISHEAPTAITPCLEEGFKRANAINSILEEIRLHCNFKRWFLGKYHKDKRISPKFHLVFEDVVKID